MSVDKEMVPPAPGGAMEPPTGPLSGIMACVGPSTGDIVQLETGDRNDWMDYQYDTS